MIEVLNEEINKFFSSHPSVDKNALSQIKKRYSSTVTDELSKGHLTSNVCMIAASQLKIRLASFVVAQDEGRAAYFIAVENSEILAHCSLTNIIYGPLKGCHIGYGVAEVYEGKGLMMKVCKQAVDHAFNKLKLNRLMAAYMPHNSRSETLLNKLGFNQEGLAKKYLQINGAWEDHVLTSLLNPKNT